jgi:lysozyme
MTFQMGATGVSKFRNMILALQSHSYMDAAAEMLDSRWAKQTPNRAKKLSSQMEELAN